MLRQSVSVSCPWTTALLRPAWPQADARQGVVAHAKKKSGKKKKNKKKTENGESASTSAAPRIGLNESLNVSRMEEAQKAPAKRAVQGRPVAGYRRASEKRQVETNVQEAQARRAEEQQISRRRNTKAWSPGIESIYGTKKRDNAPVLVVDGYNVMRLPGLTGRHAGGRRRRRASDGGESAAVAAATAAGLAAPTAPLQTLTSGSDSSGSSSDSDSDSEARFDPAVMQEERRRLEDRLRAYAIYVQARVVVVWDGMGYAGDASWRGQGFAVEEHDDLTVVYTSATEADTFIGRAAREFVQRGAYHALVVTNDAEVQALASAPSVYPVKSDEFLDRLVNAEKASRLDERDRRARADGRAAARGTGGAQGVLAGLEVRGSAGADGPLALEAMMAGFDNSEDYLCAQEQGLTALQFYKGGGSAAGAGSASNGKSGGNGVSDRERTDHNRARERRRDALGRDDHVASDFADLKGILDDFM